MEKTKTASFDLHKNGMPTYRAIRKSVVRQQLSAVSLSGHLKLNKRDAVFVRVTAGLVKPSFTSMFSGHLVKPI